MEPDEKKQLSEIHEAVIGNANTGNLGLLKRVRMLEGKVAKITIGAASTYGIVEVLKAALGK